jgi:hypothetical protein
MADAQSDVDELLARKALLERQMEGYQAGVSEVAGPCSKSSLRRQIEECEMALEQVRAQLGEG